jgi:hypothetical protein
MGVLAAAAAVASSIALAAPANAATATFKATPNPVVENDHGDASFTLQARHLPASTHYNISSPGLAVACDGSPVFWRHKADRNGAINLAVHARNCDPGTYRITLNQVEAPHTSRFTSVTIHAPQPVPGTGFKASPSPVTETDDGVVAFVVNGSSLDSSTDWLLDSPGLNNACSAWDRWFDYGDSDNPGNSYNKGQLVSYGSAGYYPFNWATLLSVRQADFDGNLNIAVEGFGCDPGTYLITGDELQAPHSEYATSVTIMPPGTDF